jgi:hypothetical protein
MFSDIHTFTDQNNCVTFIGGALYVAQYPAALTEDVVIGIFSKEIYCFPSSTKPC